MVLHIVVVFLYSVKLLKYEGYSEEAGCDVINLLCRCCYIVEADSVLYRCYTI